MIRSSHNPDKRLIIQLSESFLKRAEALVSPEKKRITTAFISFLLLLFVSAPDLQGQSNLGFNLTPSGEPTSISGWNVEGKFWDYQFDPCLGQVHFAFVMFRDNDADELETLDFAIKDGGGTERQYFQYSFDSRGGFTRRVASNGTGVYLRTDAAISNIHFYTYTDTNPIPDDDYAIIEFTYNLNKTNSINEFDPRISIEIDAAWYEQHVFSSNVRTTTSFSLDFGGSFPDAPVAAPSVNRLPDELGFRIDWGGTSVNCDGKNNNGKGPQLELVRIQGGSEKVLTTINYDSNVDFYEDEGNDSDNVLDRCLPYSYEIRAKVVNERGGLAIDTSPESVEIIYEPVRGAPTSVTATTTTCNDVVTLNWTYDAFADEKIVIYRKLPGEAVFSKLDTLIDNKVQSYNDSIPDGNENADILYELATENFCGETPAAERSSATGRLLEELDPPTEVEAVTIVNGVSKGIRVTWTDNTDFEDSYLVTRQLKSGGGVVSFEVDKNITSFDDLNVANCEVYLYTVKAVNDCSPEGSGDPEEVATVTVNTDISEVISAGDLTASRGYFKDRVTLTWSVGGESKAISRYKLYARPLDDTGAPVLVGTVEGTERSFDDTKVQAGEVLEYFLVGEADCGEDILHTNNAAIQLATSGVAKAVGFRSPEGVINGNISFSGGNPVKDVKVIVQNESGALGKSLSFDGDDLLRIRDAGAKLNAVSDEVSVSVLLKPQFVDFATSEVTVLLKENNYRIRLTDEGAVIWDLHDGSGWVSTESVGRLESAGFASVNVTYDGSKARIYLDGEPDTEADVTANLPEDNTSDIVVGEGYVGHIDELSVWHIAREADLILRDHVRLLNNEEDGMSGYWPINVGLGSSVFDASKIGNAFNGNDAVIEGAIWSDEIPTADQLSTLGYTNAQGNYTIGGVKFSGAGENFQVTPTLGVHEFSPNQKIIFIGDGNLVQNSVDFEDKSSFRVTGRVIFAYKNLEAGSEGVQVFMDGEPVVNQTGGFLITDTNGLFEMDVPIGNHVISVKKENHQFSNEGRFPADPDSEFNFNEPLSGLTFTDETTRRLIGKVVGGTREGDKPIGFDRTVNNIGVASFKLRSKDGLVEELIETDAKTGEYEISLPPKIYDLLHPADETLGVLRVESASLRIDSHAEVDLLTDFSPGAESDTVKFIDNVPLPVNAVRVDTVDNNTREVRQISYDYKVNHIYRKAAEVFLYNGDGSEEKPFLGEESYNFITTEDTTLIPLLGAANEYLLGHPVVRQNNTYQFTVVVQEVYTNHDGSVPVVDKVPVKDATILLENNMMTPYYFNGRKAESYPLSNDVPVITLDEADGDTTILFRAEEPEFTANVSDPSISYTKNFKLTVIAGGNVSHWPNPADQNEVFRLYVLGNGSSENSSFVTQGPDVVQHIIRDPFGGESFAYLEEGSTVSTSSTYSFAEETEGSLEASLSFKFPSDIKITGNLGFDYSVSYDSTGSISNEVTFTERYETRADAQEVGAGGDIYISKSNNYESGFTENLRLILKSSCDDSPGIKCLEGSPSVMFEGKEYSLGQTFSAFLKAGDTPTFSIFSQNHILNVLIPDLEDIRNSLFIGATSRYVSNVTQDHPLYGSNNDDSRWNLLDNDPFIYDFVNDKDGPSYTFSPVDPENDVDSVAWVNQQIRLWQDAIRRNEEEKARAAVDPDRENFSVAAGVTFSREVTSSNTTSYEVVYGTTGAFTAGFEVALDNDGLGFSGNLKASLTLTETVTNTTARDSTFYTTYGYEIFEPDVGDFLSFDVVPGSNGDGPIFILQGGQTSCPHEEAVTTLFHEPGTQIGKSTLQRDKPRLGVEVAQLFNVPADGQAAFNLTLSNDSESQDDFNYTMFVIDQSNPDGAIISMDGEFFDRNRTIFVPGSSTIRKTLTLERGPTAYDYEDIKVVIASLCQSDPTDFEKVIADTVSISAFFLPICTTPEILSPTDNWTLNNRFDNKLNIEVGDFDINFPGFEYLQLEYKPGESSGWIPIRRFYRDLEAAGNPPDAEEIPKTGASFTYEWDISSLSIPDGAYDLRVISDCEILSTGGRVESDSGIKSGIIDRVNPHVFGSPQPGDGILSPGDEISIQFNEPINTAVAPQNFIMTGVLNGADLDHNISVHFDGTGNGGVTLTNPPNLKRKTFTIDFWAKRSGTGEAVMLHQGASDTELLQLGFDASDQVYFNVNGEIFETTIAITNELWNHYSFIYDHEANNAEVWVASGINTFHETKTDFSVDYQVQEAMVLGKSTLENSLPFNGFLHELRIWNRTFTESEITTNRSVVLNASTVGLLSNWTFEEGRGEFAVDKVKSRQAHVNTAWRIDPAGMSMTLNGTTSYLEADGAASFNADQDFTLELWFKTSSDEVMNFFSSGRGDGTDDNPAGWSLGIDEGDVFLETNGHKLKKGGLNLADGQWHHLALVVDRLTNTTLLIDGESRGFLSSDLLGAFSGDTFWFGRRGWKENGVQQSDQYFEGQLDEIRIWSTARRLREISFNRYNKLKGDELGLRLYYPFESFQLSPAQIYLSEEDLTNNANGEDAVAATLDNQNGTFADDTPPIRLPRPLQSVNFNYSVNGDKIILTPNEDNDRIENVELSIGVKNIKDLNGNRLDAPITWTAFVDRNDVVWLDDELDLEKELNAAYAFEVEITNQGGQLRDFVISNLPAWLTASPSSGTLEPTRSRSIRFEVDEGLNIGEYNEFVHLTTDFGFDERLSLNLNVFKAPPVDWTVEPSDYQFSMSLVGAVKISDILSRDKNDLIAAFIDGEVRGVAPLSYVSEFDQYQAFLSIYTNDDVGKDITYKIWDANEGLVYTGVGLSNPSAGKVSQDAFFGTPASPVILSADTFLENTVEVGAGWNWISFNLNSDDLTDINTLMRDFPAMENDQLKGTEFFDQYDPVNGWLGSLSANGGVQKERMYKLNSTNAGEITFTGSLIDVTSSPVNLSEGWNWVGFLGRNNQSIDEALSNITNLSVGDRIKGQREFAIYGGVGIGWVGSLSSLKPGEGYLYYANAAGVLTYPELSVGISSTANGQSLVSSSRTIDFARHGLDPAQFETNMNMVVKVSGIELQPDDLLIIKSGEEVAGLAYAINNPVLDEPVFFVTVYGNFSSVIDFELLRGNRTFVLTPRESAEYTYQADKQSGSLKAPVVLLAEEISLESITAKATPNPFEQNVRVSWLATSPPGHMEIMDTDGVVMQSLTELKGGRQDVSFAGMAQGMYLIRLHFEQKTLVLKVIKSK